MNQTTASCPCCGTQLTVSDSAPVPIDWAQLITLLIQILQSFLGGKLSKDDKK